MDYRTVWSWGKSLSKRCTKFNFFSTSRIFRLFYDFFSIFFHFFRLFDFLPVFFINSIFFSIFYFFSIFPIFFRISQFVIDFFYWLISISNTNFPLYSKDKKSKDDNTLAFERFSMLANRIRESVYLQFRRTFCNSVDNV